MNLREKDILQVPLSMDMMRGSSSIVLALLMLQVLAVLFLATAPAVAEINEIVIPPGETVVWADDDHNLSEKVTVQGTLIVRNYIMRFNISQDGEASFWVTEGGLLEFDNVTLLHENLSAYLFFKVEGRFVCRDSYIEYLTGQFVTGGGIKVVNGEVEMYDTRISDCQVQGVYLEGPDSNVLLDNVTMDSIQYGVHVTGQGTVTLQNGCFLDLYTRAGVLVNRGEAHISNTTFFGDRSNETQGIAARESQITVFDSVIHNNRNDGIELTEESSAHIANTEIYDSIVGIRMTSSSAEIVECRIYDCVDGLNIYLSDPKVRRTHLIDNLNGISSKECAPGYLLEDCVIGGNTQYGVYAISEGFVETDTQWTTALGVDNTIARWVQWWLLDVNVTDKSGIPVSGARVIVEDSEGTEVFVGTTDALGSVRDIELEGSRIENDGTESVQRSYLVRIEDDERWAEQKVKMDQDKVLQVSLGEAPTITDSPYFWAVPVVLVLLFVVTIGYWWFRIR
jgi:hypothetical protein